MAATPEVKIKVSLNGQGQVTASIKDVQSSFSQLAQRITTTSTTASASIDHLGSKIDGIRNKMDRISSAVQAFAGFEIIKGVTGSLIEATKSFQAIEYSMLAGTNSIEDAGKEMQFIRFEADRLGIAFETAARYYGSFLVSAKAANVSMKDTHDLFRATTEAATVFHLSGARLHSVFYALEQMMSMGVIRTQELKIQLGQALPGAFENLAKVIKHGSKEYGLAAKGLDLTDALRAGILNMEEFAKYLTAAISMSRGVDENVTNAAQSLNANIGRMQTALFDFKRAFAGGLFEEMVTSSLKQVASLMEGITDFLTDEDAHGKFSRNWAGHITVITMLGTTYLGLSQILSRVGTLMSYNIRTSLQEAGVTKIAATAKLKKAEATTAAARAAEAETVSVLRSIELERIQIAQQIQIAQHELAKAIRARARLRSADAIAKADAKIALIEAELNTITARGIQLESQYVVAKEASIRASGQLATATAAETTARNIATASTGRFIAVQRTATLVAKGFWALIGGWYGVALVAVYGLYKLATHQSKYTETMEESKKVLEDTKNLQEAQIEGAISGLEQQIKKQKELVDAERAALVQRIANARAAHNASFGEATPVTADNPMGWVQHQTPTEFEVPEDWLAALREGIILLDALTARAKKLNDEQDRINERATAVSEAASATRFVDDFEKETKKIENRLAAKKKKADGAYAEVQDLELDRKEAIDSLAERYSKVRQIGNEEERIAYSVEEQHRSAERINKAYEARKRAVLALAALEKAQKEKDDRTEMLKKVSKGLDDLIEKTEDYESKLKDLDPLEQERNRALTDASQAYWDLVDAMTEAGRADKETLALLDKLEKAHGNLATAINKVSDAKKDARAADQEKDFQDFLLDLRNSRERYDSYEDTYKREDPNKSAERREKAEKAFREMAEKNKWVEGTPEYETRWAAVIVVLDELDKKLITTRDMLELVFEDAFDEIHGDVSGALVDMMDRTTSIAGGFRTMREAFTDALKKMVADMISSRILQFMQQLVQYALMLGMGTPTPVPVPAPVASGGGPYTSGMVPAAATGGKIVGPGGPKDDEVPVLMSNGEYAIQAAAVRHYGEDFFDALNQMRWSPQTIARKKYAEGGMIGRSIQPAVMGGGSDVEVNIYNESGSQVDTRSNENGPDGKKILDIFIGAAAADVQGNGKLGRAIQTTFGISRAGVRRGG